MYNITDLNHLKSFSTIDYDAQFKTALDAIEEPKIDEALLGTSIKHYDVTPLQEKKKIALVILVLSTLAGLIVVLMAISFKNKKMYFATIPAGIGALGSIISLIYFFTRVDLDKADIREKEKEKLRTLKLAEFTKRYSTIDKPLCYALLGNDPKVYQEIAWLTKRHITATHIYTNAYHDIIHAYEKAIAPARNQLHNAKMAEGANAIHGTVRQNQGKYGFDDIMRDRRDSALLASETSRAQVAYNNAVTIINPEKVKAHQAVWSAYQKAILPLTTKFNEVMKTLTNPEEVSDPKEVWV